MRVKLSHFRRRTNQQHGGLQRSSSNYLCILIYFIPVASHHMICAIMTKILFQFSWDKNPTSLKDQTINFAQNSQLNVPLSTFYASFSNFGQFGIACGRFSSSVRYSCVTHQNVVAVFLWVTKLWRESEMRGSVSIWWSLKCPGSKNHPNMSWSYHRLNIISYETVASHVALHTVQARLFGRCTKKNSFPWIYYI